MVLDPAPQGAQAMKNYELTRFRLTLSTFAGIVAHASHWWRHYRASRWSTWGQPWGDQPPHMRSEARLVPLEIADADPATRGPIDGSGGGA